MGLLMPSNTEQSRNRYLASVLRLMFGPVALLVLFHAEPVFAVSPGVVSIAAPSANAAVDAGVSPEAELPMCDRTDISLAVAPRSCLAVTPEAATPDAVTPDVMAGAAQAEAAEVPGDKAAVKAAPMCASDGTSIAAPVEIQEIDRGHFEPLPCDAPALLALLGLQLREGGIQQVAAREVSRRAPLQSPSLSDGNDGIGALSVPLYWPERAPPSTLASHWRGGLAWQPGHRSRIDRPPSLRA